MGVYNTKIALKGAQAPRGLRKNRSFASAKPGFCTKCALFLFALTREQNKFASMKIFHFPAPLEEAPTRGIPALAAAVTWVIIPWHLHGRVWSMVGQISRHREIARSPAHRAGRVQRVLLKENPLLESARFVPGSHPPPRKVYSAVRSDVRTRRGSHPAPPSLATRTRVQRLRDLNIPVDT